jgi:ABC-type branched-subunit amino acid transport system ATPase component
MRNIVMEDDSKPTIDRRTVLRATGLAGLAGLAGCIGTTDDEVFGHVQAVNDLETAILMVEQNATKGLGISDRGYVLDQGTVRFEDEASALLDNDDVSKLYLGG